MTSAKGSALLLTHIRQLVSPQGDGPLRGTALGELGIIEDAAVLCVGGKIVSVGTTSAAVRDKWVKGRRKDLQEIDCRGKVVLPGFVDSHTHPVFAAPRLLDFEKRCAGATESEIAEAGGGIWSTVAGVREESRAQLVRFALRAFEQMSAQGTTTIEAKSGYGLTVESELKSLEAIRDAASQFAGTVVPTLMGAYAVPPELRDQRAEYVRQVCEDMIPQADERALAWFVDVSCDRDAFDGDEAEHILTAAWQRNFGARLHICQFAPTPLHGLLKFNLASVDHLDCIQEEDIAELAQTGTIATLLPASNYFLHREPLPPARKLIDAGAAVALATGYNPGSAPTPSMPLVLSLACTQLKMSPAEAIAAATLNGAHALRIADRKGSIAPGKDADLAVFDAQDYREIPYWFGVNKCAMTIMNGKVQSQQ
jgi:imidazolonepropionase